HLAPTYVSAFGESEQVGNGALKLLWLFPVALAVGVLVSKFTPKTHIAGAVLLAFPLVFIAWAGFRHVRPLDYKPTRRVAIAWKSTPTYRGVVGSPDRTTVVKVLGSPDRTLPDGTSSVDLVYGRDDFVVTGGNVEVIDIKDPSAETPEGVGIGDNLALV